MNSMTTNGIFDSLTGFFSKSTLFLGAFFLTVAFTGGVSATEEGPEYVGEVSMVLGRAFIEGPAHKRRRVEVGAPVRINDQIITGANGHVHIRFIDQALVSVRPDSQLEVVRYQYDARQPELSAVKFNLIEGVTRTISGEAARSARQRFRLNTPIAAIGVRGTDFVVSVTPDTVRALVNEGIIVMAPFSEQCTAEAEGPCVDNAIELSGESLQILELNANAPVATLATHERDPEQLREDVQELVASNGRDEESEAEDKTVSSDVYLESVTSVKVAEDARQVVKTPPPVEPPPAPEPEPVIDFTPPKQVEVEVLTNRQLVWGRWAWSNGVGELERITMTAGEAIKDREITVGNGDYGLFRDEGDRGARVDDGLGVVGFALSSAQAYYSSASGIVAMHVKGGSLNIDFDANTFATQLSLDHLATGLVDITAAGRIFSGGYFYDRSATQNVVGAVSLDGREAGYYFNKQLQDGGVHGLTLWDSR